MVGKAFSETVNSFESLMHLRFAGWLVNVFTRVLQGCRSKVAGKYLKGTVLGLRPFLAAESPLKMMKNAFYFASKAHFVLKIFKFLCWVFGHVEKGLDKKNEVNLKFCEVTVWLVKQVNLIPDKRNYNG